MDSPRDRALLRTTSYKLKPGQVPFRPAGINTTPRSPRATMQQSYSPSLRRSTKRVDRQPSQETSTLEDGTSRKCKLTSATGKCEDAWGLFPILSLRETNGQTMYPTFGPRPDHICRPGPYATPSPSVRASSYLATSGSSDEKLTSVTQPHPPPARSSSLGFRPQALAKSASKQKPKSRSKPHTNLPLPPEIRDQIYSYLLTMAATPVEYLPPSVRHQRATYLKAYNRALPPKSVHQARLRKVYFSLILTSKGVKADATRALFYCNEWFLRISLVRDLLPEGTGGRTLGLLRGRNGMGELQRTFGPNVLSLVKTLRIKIVSECPSSENRMRAYLDAFAHALVSNPNSLKSLFVEWSNYYSVDSQDSSLERKRQIKYCRSRRRDAKGLYKRTASAEEWNAWAKQERILEPLLVVRNVPVVKITGNVTPVWASYLESVMMGKEGPVPKYVSPPNMPVRVKV